MLQMNYTSAERHALPIIDLHHERSLERKMTARGSSRSLFAIGALLVAFPMIIIPLVLQILSVHDSYVSVHRQLRGVQKRLLLINQANAGLTPALDKWSRYNRSLADRAAWRTAILTLAAAVPGHVYFDQMQMTMQNTTIVLTVQGSAQDMPQLKMLLNSLAASPDFAQAHLTDTARNAALGEQGISFKIAGPITGVLPSAATGSGS